MVDLPPWLLVAMILGIMTYEAGMAVWAWLQHLGPLVAHGVIHVLTFGLK